eukprot:3577473-Ditylum_brightwellii.AAC.1
MEVGSNLQNDVGLWMTVSTINNVNVSFGAIGLFSACSSAIIDSSSGSGLLLILFSGVIRNGVSPRSLNMWQSIPCKLYRDAM